MITSLTKKQKDTFPHYVDKWTKIGLCTNPANRSAAEIGIRMAYKTANLPSPEVAWFDGPMQMYLTICAIDTDEPTMQDIDKARVKALILKKEKKSKILEMVNNSGYGQHDAYFLAFYDFFRIECNLVEQTDPIEGLRIIAENAGWYYPTEKICFISERHSVCSMTPDKKIHAENGPAIAYPDGFEIYALNGIRMKKEYVMIDSEKMTPQMVMKEKNVNVRRELARKIGIDRLASYGKEIEASNGYRLLDMSKIFEGINYAPHLLMENPSLPGTFHLEGVGQDCKTVQDAINWRAGGREWNPEVLT